MLKMEHKFSPSYVLSQINRGNVINQINFLKHRFKFCQKYTINCLYITFID